MDINHLVTMLSILAAILAWIAKLRWSKEYIAAKEESIKAKDAQIETLKLHIESLKDLTPMKIREYFNSMKEQLEEYNELLKSQLENAKKEQDDADKQIQKKIDEFVEQIENIRKKISIDTYNID